MTSVLSFNAHLRYIKDTGAFNEFIRDLQPAYLLAYVDQDDHAMHINTMAALLPNTKIIARVFHQQDGAFHLPADDGRKYIASPADCINKWGNLGRGGKILNLLNEPGTYSLENTRILIDWCIQAINLAVAQNVSLMIGNFGTGHPPITVDGKQWTNEFDRLLQVLSENRNKGIYLGLHEYGLAEGRVGRINAMVKRCETLGIPPPAVIMSEYGIDHSPNEDAALQGYRTRGMGGRQYADWLTAQIKDTYRPHIDSGVLKALCVFSYGNSGGWNSFDVENDEEFKTRLLEHKASGILETVIKSQPPEVTPVPPAIPPAVEVFVPPTNEQTKPRRYRLQQTRNIRTMPSGTAPIVQELPMGKTILVYEGSRRPGLVGDMWHDWLYGQISGGIVGWISITGIQWTEANATSTGEIPVVKDPPATDTPPPAPAPVETPPAPFFEVSRDFCLKMQAHHQAIADLWGSLLTPMELPRAA